MIDKIFLSVNVLFCCGAGFVILIRRQFSVSSILLVFSLFLISGLSFIDLQTINQPLNVMFSRKIAVFVEASTVISLYFYTKISFRNNTYVCKGIGFCIAGLVSFLLLSYVAISPVEKLIFSPDFVEEKILFLSNQGFVFYLVLMIFLVFGLVQLERTLAALHQLQRWQIKLEIIGIGLIMASFALYFSQSLLYRSIDMGFLMPRLIAILFAIGLVVYSRLFRGEGKNLAISRGIAHRSFVLLIVGGYLILLGLMGEGLRYLNIVDAKLIFYFFLLAGGLGISIIFLSEKLRRKLRVVLHKNFYQSKYDYREEWEKFAQRVSIGSSLSKLQVLILDLFCDCLACKGASFYLYDMDSKSYHQTAAFNLRRDWRQFSEDDSLITQLGHNDWIVNLKEGNPYLDDSLISAFEDVGAFLVIPLYFREELAGFIILGEQIDPNEEMNYEDYDLLRMLARQAITTVQGLRLAEQVSTTRELAAIGKVSTFVLHDLKNQVSGLSLMLENARDYIDNPEFQQDMLETVENTVINMKELVGRLKNLKEKPELVVAPVELKKVIRDAVETAGGNFEVNGETVKVAADDEELYKVVLNLLVNAAEASNNEHPVQVTYGTHQEAAIIQVSDRGCGMSADFIQNKLFKPFVTTKKHGFGIGLYQCKQIIESHQGNISVESNEGEGTKFTILLPIAPDL